MEEKSKLLETIKNIVINTKQQQANLLFIVIIQDMKHETYLYQTIGKETFSISMGIRKLCCLGGNFPILCRLCMCMCIDNFPQYQTMKKKGCQLYDYDQSLLLTLYWRSDFITKKVTLSYHKIFWLSNVWYSPPPPPPPHTLVVVS